MIFGSSSVSRISSEASRTADRASRFACSPQAIGLASVILIVSILQQVIGHQNFDNGWLFTVAERVLDGAEPYVDFIESNPPASFLIYMPAVALARLLGTSVEFMVCACLFAGCLGVILFSGRILRRADLLNPAEAGVLLNMSVFVMLFVPGIQFAQREHIAILCLMPLLAIYAARAQAGYCSRMDAVAAGLMAGIAISIKLHFALAALVPLFLVVVRRRSPGPLFKAENWAILCVVFAYAALVVLWCPGFLNILPMLLDVYVPLKQPLEELVLQPTFFTSVVIVCGVLLAQRKGRSSIMVAMSLCASVAFMGAYLVQGKGFPNHPLPCVGFALLAASALAAPAIAALLRKGDEAPEWRAQRWLILFAFVPMMAAGSYFCGVTFQFMGWEEHPGLRVAVQKLAPPHPRLLAASTLFHVGHPVVRQVGGLWVGRPNGLWITEGAQDMIDIGIGDDAYRARLATYIDRDARMLLEDVRGQKPDIILSDIYRGTAKAMRHPDIIAALVDYDQLEKVGDIMIWRRKPSP